MTSQFRCDLYYSVSGDPFEIQQRFDDTIEHVSTVLNIYSREEEELPNTTAIQKAAQVMTELSLPYPIKKGQFFNSESCCMFFNDTGELLKVNGEHLFKVIMLRDASDFERLVVKFEQVAYEGRHEWEKVAVGQE